MSWFMVDVESNGPIPGDFSMTEVGVVRMDADLKTTFHGKLCPLPGASWQDEAYAVVGYDHATACTFPDPFKTMTEFGAWVKSVNRNGKPCFIADNNGFDYGFVNWYFWHFLGESPFGHSSTNLGSLYKGLIKDFSKNFKHLRNTKHDHNPVNDARGNAEALQTMVRTMGLKMFGVT
jgi:exonuclease